MSPRWNRSERSRRPAERRGWLRAALLAGLAGALAAGCGGYRLGPTNGVSARSRSVQVNLFPNATLLPRASEAVAQSLRRQLTQDGTYRLATRGDADIVVSGSLVKFERVPLSFQAADTLTPRDYFEKLTAHVKAVEQPSGKVLLDQQITGETVIHIGADLASIEREASPLLADDLARRVTSLLVDGSW